MENNRLDGIEDILVDMIQFLDRKGHSGTIMRWKIDVLLNYNYSVERVYEHLKDCIKNKKYLYGKIPTEDMD